MDFDDELKLERFKILTDRQKYFTELSRDTYNLYLKTFIYIVTAGVALVSLQEKFNIPVGILTRLLNILILLLIIVGISAIIQIVFCLVRWYKLKADESKINSNAVVEWWAWIYEGLYVVTILASILIILLNRNYISEIANIITSTKK